MTTNPDSSAKPAPPAKSAPHAALLIATSLGMGYMPIAPGTWGAAAGAILTAAIAAAAQASSPAAVIYAETAAGIVIALVGVWAASRAAEFARTEDPQFVVIDEVSGQMLTLVLGLALYAWTNRAALDSSIGASLAAGLVNWKYLLAGFILFRVFDIWKPFPARQAESLHGGLGIMADDWIAGAYGALALWLAQRLGL